MKKIRVLIVDDSAVMRKFLTETLSKEKGIEVVATALDPFIAVDKIKKFNPDVLTLDVEMPRMDGLTFLSKLMIARPMPVVMVSSFTEAGARVTMRALELGAVDFVLKPALDAGSMPEEFSRALIEKIIAASRSKVFNKIGPADRTDILEESLEKYTADVILPPKKGKTAKRYSEAVIAIGASTGGTEAIAGIFKWLPEDLPGIVGSAAHAGEVHQGLCGPDKRDLAALREGGGAGRPPVSRHGACRPGEPAHAIMRGCKGILC